MKLIQWLPLVVGMVISGNAMAEAPKIVLVKKEGQLNPDMTNPGAVEYPSWFKNSFLDFRDDVKDATAHNKRLVLFFYQDGCPYCKILVDTNLAQKNITDILKTRFDVITVNLWGDRDVTDIDGVRMIEKQFAEKMKVMYTPTVLFFDEQAKVVLRVNGYYEPHKFLAALNYAAGKHEKESSFRDYFAKLSPPAASGTLHTQRFFTPPPHTLTRVKKAGAKPLLVLFEQQQCPACDELHNDALKRKETLEQLARFDVVQLDMWSKTPVTTPDGRVTSANVWAKELDIKYAPSLLFFDASGKEVMRTEGYLKSFHNQSVMDYVASSAYKSEPSFQRYIEWRAEKLREEGVTVNIME